MGTPNLASRAESCNRIMGLIGAPCPERLGRVWGLVGSCSALLGGIGVLLESIGVGAGTF